MIERTEHGNNIADQIQDEDAYGIYEQLTLADLWNILDQFQTHIMNTTQDSQTIIMLSKWMQELEQFDEPIETF